MIPRIKKCTKGRWWHSPHRTNRGSRWRQGLRRRQPPLQASAMAAMAGLVEHESGQIIIIHWPELIKAILGWFPLLTTIPVRSQWGRYNLPRFIWCFWVFILILGHFMIKCDEISFPVEFTGEIRGAISPGHGIWKYPKMGVKHGLSHTYHLVMTNIAIENHHF